MPVHYNKEIVENLSGKKLLIKGIEYSLQEIVGKGSYSVVYKATKDDPTAAADKMGIESDEHGDLAVKCLCKSGLVSASQKQRQIQEIALLRILLNSQKANPERIAKLIESIEEDSMIYLVFQCYATNLFHFIISGPSIDSGLAHKLFMELLEGVDGMHQCQIYHRDLKPENILLDGLNGGAEISVKIADFGLATRFSRSRDWGCGSIRYMSQECLNASRVYPSYDTAKNDIWSIGIIMINILSQKNPWNSPQEKDQHFRYHMLQPTRDLTGKDTFSKVFEYSKDFSKILREIFRHEQLRCSAVRLGFLLTTLNGRFFSDDHIESNQRKPDIFHEE